MVAFNGSLALMEQFSPDELSRLIGRGDDSALMAIPEHLSHAEKVALRRARIAAIDRAQGEAKPDAQRPSEASVRGYVRRKDTKKTAPHAAPDDQEKASQAWLKAHLSNLYRIGAIWAVTEARLGYPRGVWRAAVAGILTQRRADIRSPEWAIARIARGIAEGEISDERGLPSFCVSEDWPKAMYLFARVRLPSRYAAKSDNNDG